MVDHLTARRPSARPVRCRGCICAACGNQSGGRGVVDECERLVLVQAYSRG
ncbi:MAG: RNA polymerase-binding protein RbpA, partial [Rhodococcus sp. (in: high G+C Gram-positive bacteria)]